jgi:3-phenylpropionate/cinnamic acid dioxygenase small subunit
MNAASEKLLREGVDLLNREARYLDERLWDEWLELYCEDCLFWAPAWRDDNELTSNFEREVSIFYFKSRAGLSDRVWRIRSGQAPSLTPLSRTTHVIANTVLDEKSSADSMTLHSAWTCHVYSLRTRTQHVFFGRHQHDLVLEGDDWRIKRKKIVLMNDYVPGMIDVFCV